MAGLLTAALLFLQGLFFFIQKTQAIDLTKSIEGILRNDANMREPYRIAQSLGDLESLGLFRCSVFKNHRQQTVFQDLSFKHKESDCEPSFWFLDGVRVNTTALAINGQTWNITFATNNPKSFYLYLWIARIFVVGIFVLALIIVRFYIRTRMIEADLKQRHFQALGHLAAQVSHDIRSPLATLLAVIHSSQGLDATSRNQINNAVTRISDIANNLLSTNRAQKLNATNSQLSAESSSVMVSSEPRSVELISTLIESAVSEKRLQLRGQNTVELVESISATPEAGQAFVEIQPTEFSRILSNLINNAVEAIHGTGKVVVHMSANDGRVFLIIEDTGKGIPPDLLSKVLEHGGTFGKENGNGLGLFHAKTTLELWGGALTLESTLGIGTKVKLEIPRAHSPSWFVDHLSLYTPASVIILDDDPSIHTLWSARFETYSTGVTLHHLTSSAEMLAWYRKSLGSVINPLYLCDHDLSGSNQNGLDIIDMLGIASESILVTHRADQPELREKCSKMGIRLMSKTFVPTIGLSPTSTPAHTSSLYCSQSFESPPMNCGTNIKF
ncbi:HAMP domain-containing sensor histidine kinase [Bdellovibrionota bacterium FG-2]